MLYVYICTYKSNLLQSGIQKRLKHTVFQKDTDRGCDCFKTKISHGVDLLNPTLTAETGDKDMHNYIHKYNIWYIYKYVRHGYQPFTDSSDQPSKWCAKFQSCKIRFRERKCDRKDLFETSAWKLFSCAQKATKKEVGQICWIRKKLVDNLRLRIMFIF